MKKGRRAAKGTVFRSKDKAKRWFASASGWGLALALGSGADASTKSKRSVALAEDSQLSFSSGQITGVGWLDNTLYTYNPVAAITQGTAVGNRIGNSIFIKDMFLNMFFDTSTATNPSSTLIVRVMLLALPAQYNPAPFAGVGVGSTDIYATGASTFGILGRLDPRLCRVMCDQLVEVKPSVLVGALSLGCIKTASVGCAINQSFDYRGATAFGELANLYWVITGHSAGGNGGVTQDGLFVWDSVVTFGIV